MEFLPNKGGTVKGNITVETTYRPEIYTEYKGTKYDCRAWIRNGENYVWVATKDNTMAGTHSRAIQLANASMTENIENAMFLVSIIDSAYKYYNIFGEHNKPTGSFTGNGSAEKRTIDTGGIGSICLIYSTNNIGFVGESNAFVVNVNTQDIKFYTGEQMKFLNGILTLAIADGRMNVSGATYKYRVL